MESRVRGIPKVDRKAWFHKIIHMKTQDEDKMNSDIEPLLRSF